MSDGLPRWAGSRVILVADQLIVSDVCPWSKTKINGSKRDGWFSRVGSAREADAAGSRDSSQLSVGLGCDTDSSSSADVGLWSSGRQPSSVIRVGAVMVSRCDEEMSKWTLCFFLARGSGWEGGSLGIGFRGALDWEARTGRCPGFENSPGQDLEVTTCGGALGSEGRDGIGRRCASGFTIIWGVGGKPP